MNHRLLKITAAMAVLAFAVMARAAELKPAANNAFERYSELTEQRLNDEVKRGVYLWVDTLPEAQRADVYARLKRGEVVEQKLETKDNGKDIDPPNALIHDWVATVFISGVNMEQARHFLQDYDNHSKFYKPDVPTSKLVSRNGDDFKIYLRMYKKKIVTVTLNTYHDVHYNQVDAHHLVSKSWTTKVAEVDDAGTPKERELPVGNDHGFLWRTNSYWHTVEKDGGVYVQCEAITLTRDIPWALKWLSGFINSASKEFLYSMMANLRTGTLAEAKQQ